MSNKQDALLSQNRERWHVAEIEKAQVKELSSELGLDPLLSKILLSRGIGNQDINAIHEFLNPNPKLLDEFDEITTPDNLSKATHRILNAIRGKEKILINGDPDADGICGATILASGLMELGADVYYEFPTRSREGHGLQVRIIDQAKALGVKLIITTDCGSKDIEASNYAKDQGVDIIITDHHILGKELPNVYAMVNPHLVKHKTAYQHLSGAGVAYKTIQALFAEANKDMPDFLLDFIYTTATLGTLSDRMSMLDPLNRLIVNKGVKALDHTKREGLKALKKVCLGDIRNIKPRQLSRTIIPRLNAPGRIGDRMAGIPDSNIVVELLLIGSGKKNAKKAQEIAELFSSVVEMDKEMKAGISQTDKVDKDENPEEDAIHTAADVDDVNEQRKYITNKIEEEIDHLIEEQVNIYEDRVIIVQGHNWNSGVIGIDTDRLKERFLRPAIILTKYDGNAYVRGSVRSIPKIDMYGVIDRVQDRFQEEFGRPLYQMEVSSNDGSRIVNAFGGHSQACGFSIHEDDVACFKQYVREAAQAIPEESFEYSYDIIDQLPFSKLNSKLVNTLDYLAPYGQCFDFPIFYLQGCLLTKGRPFGNKYQESIKPHVKFNVVEAPKKQRGRAPREFRAVGFGLWEKFCQMRSNLDPNMRYDVIFTVDRDVKTNRRKEQEIRLTVLDIRQSGDTIDSFNIKVESAQDSGTL